MFIFWVPSTRHLSNCCDVPCSALLRKRSSLLLHHYHHCKDVRGLWPGESGDLVSGPQPVTDDWGGYVLCKAHADSGRDFCLQCCPVPNRENKGEGRSMSGGSISLCTGGTLLGPGDKSTHVKNEVGMCSGGYLWLCRTTAPVRVRME